MEFENEENMCYLEFTEELEISPNLTSNLSDQQYSISEGQQPFIIEQQPFIEEPEQIEEEIEEEPELEQIEQPLYKLNNINTDASIKSEIKQLILSKVSEEVNAKILNDTSHEVEEQISFLRLKTDDLNNKIQLLDDEVESDEVRLEQSEAILLKTEEMINLLKDNIEKLQLHDKESFIADLSHKILQQQQSLELLKKTYRDRLCKERDTIKEVEKTGTSEISVLKTELAQKQDFSNKLLGAENVFNQTIRKFERSFEKISSKQRSLNNKFAALASKKISMENEFGEGEEFFSKQNSYLERFNEINNEETSKKEQMHKCENELNALKISLKVTEEENDQKIMKYEQMKDHLSNIKQNLQNVETKSQFDSTILCSTLNNNLDNLRALQYKNDNLNEQKDTLITEYTRKCQEKSRLANEKLERMNKKQILKVKMQLEIEKIQSNLNDLNSKYQASLAEVNSLNDDISKKKSDVSRNLNEIRKKIVEKQTSKTKYILEKMKNREYLLVNKKFMEEKSENIKRDVAATECMIKKLREENIALKISIEKMNESKKRLELLRNRSTKSEVLLKSKLRSPHKENFPKKVKFNEVLSFKSPSSSELSSLPVDNATQLETSLQEWLDEGEANSVEKIEEELY